MIIAVCDICGEKIDSPSSPKLAHQQGAPGRHGARFEFPLFQTPEKWVFTEIDLCLSCGLELTKAYVDLKGKRGPRGR